MTSFPFIRVWDVLHLIDQTGFFLSDNENSSSPWVGGIAVVSKRTQGGVWEPALFLGNRGGFLYFITSYISLVWNIIEWWSWAWSGLKWWNLENDTEIAAFVHLLQTLRGSFVCLGGVRCLKCLLHTGAVVIGGIFPSELEGGCLGSFRYSAWPLLGFGFVCWVQGVSEEMWEQVNGIPRPTHVPLLSLSSPTVSGKGTWLKFGKETSS